MTTEEQERHAAADLHWLATLLTGCRDTALDITADAITMAGRPNRSVSHSMHGLARSIVIAKALTAVHAELAESAQQTALQRPDRRTVPPRSWSLDPGTTRADLERALLQIEIFPRAAVVLMLFERVSLEDAAILLDAKPELVSKAHAAAARELTANLARMQGWEAVCGPIVGMSQQTSARRAQRN